MDNAVPASIKDRLTAQEMQRFLARSNARAAWTTAFNLLVVAGALALPALWLNPPYYKLS